MKFSNLTTLRSAGASMILASVSILIDAWPRLRWAGVLWLWEQT